MHWTKTILILVAFCFAASFMTACKEKPKNPVSEYGDALINSYKGAQNAADVANIDALRKGIQAYHAANGSYPEHLRDVSDLIGGPMDFDKYDYDPSTGSVAPKKPKQ